MAKERTTGVAAKVALAMAEGDTVDEWPNGKISVTPASGEQIAAVVGISPTYVRSTQTRIRRALGPQAR